MRPCEGIASHVLNLLAKLGTKSLGLILCGVGKRPIKAPPRLPVGLQGLTDKG
jgi:hypothetical protein